MAKAGVEVRDVRLSTLGELHAWLCQHFTHGDASVVNVDDTTYAYIVAGIAHLVSTPPSPAAGESTPAEEERGAGGAGGAGAGTSTSHAATVAALPRRDQAFVLVMDPHARDALTQRDWVEGGCTHGVFWVAFDTFFGGRTGKPWMFYAPQLPTPITADTVEASA